MFGRLAAVRGFAGDLSLAHLRGLTIHGVIHRPDKERLVY